MDKRRSTTTKDAGRLRTGKARGPAPPRTLSYRPVALTLGLVLSVAGMLKFYEIVFGPQREDATTPWLMALAEAELLGGLWMVGGRGAAWTRRFAVAAFGGLGAASLFQGLSGKCSCGCFGSVPVNPWLVLVFDLAAVAALLACRPGVGSEEDPPHPFSYVGLGFLGIMIASVGWGQADRVDVAGTATAGNRPLRKATLNFVGESGRVSVRTDRNGRYRLSRVLPGTYAVSAPASKRGQAGPAPTSTAAKAKAKAKPKAKAKATSPALPGREGVLWVEIPSCSQDDMALKF